MFRTGMLPSEPNPTANHPYQTLVALFEKGCRPVRTCAKPIDPLNPLHGAPPPEAEVYRVGDFWGTPPLGGLSWPLVWFEGLWGVSSGDRMRWARRVEEDVRLHGQWWQRLRRRYLPLVRSLNGRSFSIQDTFHIPCTKYHLNHTPQRLGEGDRDGVGLLRAGAQDGAHDAT